MEELLTCSIFGAGYMRDLIEQERKVSPTTFASAICASNSLDPRNVAASTPRISIR
jgi:hypothetical protein